MDFHGGDEMKIRTAMRPGRASGQSRFLQHMPVLAGGFTLIELVIVVAIVGILATDPLGFVEPPEALVPAGLGAIRQAPSP
jgi:prepilin-type N-terminal cleavage/methylation domain-containing protein